MNDDTPSVKIRAGKFEFIRTRGERRDIRDLYHGLLTLKWPQFVAVILGIYLGINLLFSLLYFIGGDSIAETHSYADDFFFSVETMATVGYGHFYPQNLYGHIVSTAEIMTGMFGVAVTTGLIFVRFSRPVARIIFTRCLVVSAFDGQPALMLRVANLRYEAMVEAEFRLMLVRKEMTKEGDQVRRFYPLQLQYERLITFPVALTLRHIIDEKSPLHGMTPRDLEEAGVRILASVVCIDTVIPAPVQSQQDYNWNDIRFGKRFVEIFTDIDDHIMKVDYGRLHDIEDAPQ